MRFVLALNAALIAAGVAHAADPTFSSSAGRLSIQTVASGLVHPWSLAFLPGGHMLVTDGRGNRLLVVPMPR